MAKCTRCHREGDTLETLREALHLCVPALSRFRAAFADMINPRATYEKEYAEAFDAMMAEALDAMLAVRRALGDGGNGG